MTSTAGRRRRRPHGAAALVCGLAGALAVGVAPATTATAAAPAPAVALPAAVQHSARDHTPAYLDASLPVRVRVRDLLGRMTLAEKVGQMTQAERADIDADPSQIAAWKLGSVLSGGGSTPAENTPTAWADMVDRYQRAALRTRLGIPLIYGVDSVHGHNNLRGATVFPHNIGLGATRDPALARRIGHLTAEETRASGPQWAFAPCVCVARDDRWGRTYESFGESPRLVRRMETVIDGLQGRRARDLRRPDHVLATAKHFAGDGLTTYGTGSGDYPIDQGVDQVDHATFDRLALSPYRPAVRKHHVGSVMPSFSSTDWTEDGLGNPTKMHANRKLIRGWLKRSMHFHGFVITDWLAIHQLPGDYRAQVRAGVMAGTDMFMEPGNAGQFIDTLTGLVRSGDVPRARIDDAVRRILRAKFRLGLFEHPLTDRRHLDEVGSAAHRRVARRAVAESQVLLRNRDHALPLRPNGYHRPGVDVYVAGSGADSLGNQAGGWTITWQGGSTTDIPGNTILDGIRRYAGEVTFSEDASRPVPDGAVGVVVVSETPYAEGYGDVGGPLWAYDPGDDGQPRPEKTMRLSAADAQAVDTVCAAVETCVVSVVSGRPLVIDPAQLRRIDALVASWLPGSQGEGVADVLFGARPFTGRLPVTWPRTVAQEPINVGDADYDPLFAFGRGLRTR